MYTYLRRDSKFYWVFSPVRLLLTGRDIIGQSIRAQTEYNMSFVSASRNDGVGRLSMSDLDKSASKQYFDFAEQVRADYNDIKDLIYIEKLTNVDGPTVQYIFIHIKNGEIQLDNQCGIDELQSEFSLLLERFNFIDSKTNRGQTVNDLKIFAHDFDSIYLNDIADKLGLDPPKYFSKGLTETTLPLEDNRFIRAEGLKERMSPKGMYKRWVPVFISVLLLVVITNVIINSNDNKVEVETVKDEWSKYRTMMTKTSPQASNRLSQDYNNLRAFNATLTGWRVVEVAHTKKQDVVYKLANEGGFVESLANTVSIISNKFGIAMVNDVNKEGTIISVKGANTPPYSLDKIERWDLRTLYQTIIDDLKIFTPSIQLTFVNFETPDPTSHAWRAMKVQLILSGSTVEDLLKIAAVTKNKPVTIIGGNYRFIDERINGNITLVLSGEEKW